MEEKLNRQQAFWDLLVTSRECLSLLGDVNRDNRTPVKGQGKRKQKNVRVCRAVR